MKNNYPLHVNKSNSIQDKKILTKYIWAFSLGDGCLYLRNDKNRLNKDNNAQFECSQLSEHEDYVLWRADILSNITSLNIQLKNDGAMLATSSNRHPVYTTMKERIYLNGRKIVEPHYLKLLDWESLAILHQDDGCLSLKDKKYKHYCLTLSTQSFSYGDNILLQRAIKDKTDILFSVTPIRTKSGEVQYRLMLQRQNDIDKFIDGIRNYVQPSFEYKVENFRKTDSGLPDDEIV